MRRKKIVSKAYHQAFDLHKPKKDAKDYSKKLEAAKQAARDAHAAAAKKFDAENPRVQQKKDKKEKKEKKELIKKEVASSSAAAAAVLVHDDGEQEGGEEESPKAVDPVVD